jgi:hypothetical protein
LCIVVIRHKQVHNNYWLSCVLTSSPVCVPRSNWYVLKSAVGIFMFSPKKMSRDQILPCPVLYLYLLVHTNILYLYLLVHTNILYVYYWFTRTFYTCTYWFTWTLCMCTTGSHKHSVCVLLVHTNILYLYLLVHTNILYVYYWFTWTFYMCTYWFTQTFCSLYSKVGKQRMRSSQTEKCRQ